MTKIRGCGTALVTPFTRSKGVDFEAFQELVRWQVDAGIDFLVPCGTTGESVTLTEQEYQGVIRSCVESAAGAVPVVAGAGANDTEQAVRLARLAASEGVDAILSVTPYYNKPTPQGLILHFREIAKAAGLAVIIYNVPSRTGINVEPDTLFRLAEIEHVAGVKEASGNIPQIMDILARRPAGFRVLSGDDSVTLPIVALGGEGVISVVSNLIPTEMTRMVALARDGRLNEAREIHYRYLKLMNLNFIESNPIPVKYALHRMGRLREIYRLPMCPLTEANRRTMDRELESLHLASVRV